MNDIIEKFEQWFDDYTAAFFADFKNDEFVSSNLRLKYDHSLRVRDEMRFLAEKLSLNKANTTIAVLTGLLHDTGRFEQFCRFRTYDDRCSVDHSLYGVQILQEASLPTGLSEQQMQMMLTAIKHHGSKKLPDDISGDKLLLCKMIRDADKLDSLAVAAEGFRQYYTDKQHNADSDKPLWGVRLPDSPEYCPEIYQAVMTGGLVDYGLVRTTTDFKLCFLSWVYDVNFDVTLERIKQRGLIEAFIEMLPDNNDMHRIAEAVREYINSGRNLQ